MFKDKFSRQTLAFIVMAVSAALLYPAAQNGWAGLIWFLIALIVGVNLLTLLKA